jgi:hypothetical protein
MKTVFSNSELVHVFANQLQAEGKTANRSMFFSNDTIYSYGYHFAIAKHIENENGKFVLFTTRSYSNTTSKHISLVSVATQHLLKVYCYNPDFSIFSNFEEWIKEAKNVLLKLANAKKPLKYLQLLQGILNEATIYAKYLNATVPTELIDICNITTKEELNVLIEKEAAKQKEKEAKEAKQKEKQHKEELTKFRNGENFSIYAINHNFAYLRYNKDTNRIQTTQNVYIPFEVAKKFYNIIKGGINNIDNLQILDYRVIELNKNFIQIGCHKIEFKEINRIASELSF